MINYHPELVPTLGQHFRVCPFWRYIPYFLSNLIVISLLVLIRVMLGRPFFLPSHISIVPNYMPLICKLIFLFLPLESYCGIHRISLWFCKQQINARKRHDKHLNMPQWHGSKAYRRLETFHSHTNLYVVWLNNIPLTSLDYSPLSPQHWNCSYDSQILGPEVC